MRITTWNVNGLRAVLNKGAWEPINQLGADVLCLQEIKTRPDQLPPEQAGFHTDYIPVWNPASKPGYSGVATLVRGETIKQSFGIGDEAFDSEGRVIQTCFEKFNLFNIYFPNGQRDQGRLTYKLDFYARLLELCDFLHHKGEKVILCGDFNTAHNEIDLRNAKSNQVNSGFLPEERAWIDRYLEHGFVDAYRNLYPDRVQYTWWTFIGNARQRNVGWRLDYFLVSESLIPYVRDVVIHDDVLGSDHCPVSLDLEI